jgi:hypothetical protein
MAIEEKIKYLGKRGMARIANMAPPNNDDLRRAWAWFDEKS